MELDEMNAMPSRQLELSRVAQVAQVELLGSGGWKLQVMSLGDILSL